MQIRCALLSSGWGRDVYVSFLFQIPSQEPAQFITVGCKVEIFFSYHFRWKLDSFSTFKKIYNRITVHQQSHAMHCRGGEWARPRLLVGPQLLVKTGLKLGWLG